MPLKTASLLETLLSQLLSQKSATQTTDITVVIFAPGVINPARAEVRVSHTPMQGWGTSGPQAT